MARRPWLIAASCSLPSCLYSSWAWAHGMGGIGLGGLAELFLFVSVIVLFGCTTAPFLWLTWPFILGRAPSPRSPWKKPWLYKLFGVLAGLLSLGLLGSSANSIRERAATQRYLIEAGYTYDVSSDYDFEIFISLMALPALLCWGLVLWRHVQLRRGRAADL